MVSTSSAAVQGYEDCEAIGIVDKVDPYSRTFWIDGERFNMADIVGAQLE
jgi:hypothetical protein